MDAPSPDHETALAPRRRVRVGRNAAAYAFSNRVGTIVGPDPLYAGHYVVRLDEPAIAIRPDGSLERLNLVTEPGDGLDVLLS